MTEHATIPGRGGTWAVWEYLMLTWRRYAVSSVAEAVGAPLLYLLAMGLGLGSLVDRGAGAAQLGGVGYLQFIAPALLAAAAVQIAVMEASYPTFGRFKWTPVYFGVCATPVTPRQIAAGQTLFIGTRGLISAVLYYLVLLLFGAGGGVAGPLMIIAAVGTGLACAVWVLALSAKLQGEGSAFNVVFRFVVVPMTLFSGSFFPIEQIPQPLRALAWISPLWHGNELARAAALGGDGPGALAGHALFLVVLGATGFLVARRQFGKSLVS